MYNNTKRLLLMSIFAGLMSLSSIANAQISVSQNAATIGKYEVYELTITHDQTPYANVWENVIVTTTFNKPGGGQMTVGGFYYDTNTWKVRIAGILEGNWTWSLTFNTGSNTYHANGSFNVTASANHGFLRLGTTNKYRFSWDDGTPAYIYGFGDGSGSPPTQRSMDAATGGVPADIYFGAYDSAGFNIFRQSIANCAFNIWQTIDPAGNRYLINESKSADDIAKKVKSLGWAHWFVPFAWMLYNAEYTDTAKINAVKRYLKYCVDRYGAYTDLWEIANEARINSGWLDIIYPYLKSIDPYGHPVNGSVWLTFPAQLPYMDWGDAHSYYGANTIMMAASVNDNATWLKTTFPNRTLLCGEYGSGGNWPNYDPPRFAQQLWAGYFTESNNVWWNMSFGKRPGGGSGNSNMFIGAEERAMTRVFRDITDKFPLSMTYGGTVYTAGDLTLQMSLADFARYAAYISSSIDWNGRTGVTINVTRTTANNTALWIDPDTGGLLGTTSFGSGTTNLTIPPFYRQILLLVATDTDLPKVASTSANQNTVNVVFSEGINSVYAADRRNYTVENPVGTILNLSGATISYDNMRARISGINLGSGKNYKVTVRNVRDIGGNKISEDGTNNLGSGTVSSGSSYSISGYVTRSGLGISGIVVSVSGSNDNECGSCITGSDGFYVFNGLNSGYHLLTASKQGCALNQETFVYSNLTGNQSRNITGSYSSAYSIGGYVRDASGNPISGVPVNLIGDISCISITADDGSYAFNNLPGGKSYAVSPYRPGVTCSPVNRLYASLSANQSNQNFTGSTPVSARESAVQPRVIQRK